MTALELAELVGLSEDGVTPAEAPETSMADLPALRERHQRFLSQLGERDGPGHLGRRRETARTTGRNSAATSTSAHPRRRPAT